MFCHDCIYYSERASVRNFFKSFLYNDPDADGHCSLLNKKVRGFDRCDNYIEKPNANNSNYRR